MSTLSGTTTRMGASARPKTGMGVGLCARSLDAIINWPMGVPSSASATVGVQLTWNSAVPAGGIVTSAVGESWITIRGSEFCHRVRPPAGMTRFALPWFSICRSRTASVFSGTHWKSIWPGLATRCGPISSPSTSKDQAAYWPWVVPWITSVDVSLPPPVGAYFSTRPMVSAGASV